jgi:hypothetical protein
VILCGYAFNNVAGLWKVIGADGFAADADGAVRVVNDLQRNDASESDICVGGVLAR